MSSPAPAELAAEVTGVHKRFGATTALVDASLAILQGETHALIGRNGAGKSTLVGILAGLTKPDRGEVRLLGEPAPALERRDLWSARVACVFQRSTILPNLSVGENLFVSGRRQWRRGVVSWKTLRTQARQLLDEWGIDVHVDSPASVLTPAQRQLVEIARSLRLGTRFVILDEPTAQLEAGDIDRLFRHVRRLHDQGVSVLYISHHLEEIYEICQNVSVLRDGSNVLAAEVASTCRDDLIAAMVGDVDPAPSPVRRGAGPGPDQGEGDAVLSVSGLTVAGACTDVNLTVRGGERVGLAGLAGAGTRQVADAVVGMLPHYRGEVRVAGRLVPPGRVDKALRAGVSHVPEDRHARGLSPNLSVAENVTLSILRLFSRAGILNPKRRDQRASEFISEFGIVTSSPRQLVSQLSGGNQQKVVLARALATSPAVLVLVKPTAGVDIASKAAIYNTIRAESDLAVLIVSDELDELAICDRVLVMVGGAVAGELAQGWRNHQIVALMEGVGRHE
ncbi:MAG: simple sugar transport system ATP-binding protein [Streptosporangiaceae bacterium]|nr:simple sugar transport system ATP-binding protein [Streptosporangiaceae bacterium]